MTLYLYDDIPSPDVQLTVPGHYLGRTAQMSDRLAWARDPTARGNSPYKIMEKKHIILYYLIFIIIFISF